MKSCPKCGTEVENRAQFCPNCGYKFSQSTSDSESDNWTRQQHKEFDDQSDEKEQRAKPKSGKGKTVTIIILLLIILGAAGGVIYGFGSQLGSNSQNQSSSQDESSSKKVIKETNSDGMSDNSSIESSDSSASSSSSSSTSSSSSASSSSSDSSSSSRMKSITNRDGSVLNGFFNSLSDAANGSDNSNLSDYFVNGDSNPSIKQYQNWSSGQSQNSDLSNVTCTVQNLSMNSGAGHSEANFDVKYHFTYNDGEAKTQVFKFNAKLERDSDGNFKILSCEPESTPIYSSNN